jgi:hypothetical protein
MGAFFAAQHAAKNRAFRSNSSACLRQACGISAAIPCAAKGLTAAILPGACILPIALSENRRFRITLIIRGNSSNSRTSFY